MARFIITGEYKDKATKDARKDLKGLTKDTQIFARVARLAWTTAGVYAARYAKNALRTSMRAAADDERAQQALNQTLENFAGASVQATIKANDQITAMESMYGVADDLLRPSLARLARSTGDVNKAFAGLELAMNISKATGQSLEKVSAILGRAYDGNLTGLTKLGIGMTKASLKGKKVDDVIKDLTRSFDGFAKRELTTTASKFDKLNVAADHAKETIGVALIGALTQVGGAAGDIDKATKSIEDLGTATADLITGLTQKKNGRSMLDDMLSGFEQLAKPFQWVIKRVIQNAAEERKLKEAAQKTNEAILARVNSYRRLELARLGVLKVEEDTTDTQKKTLEQLMAEEAARKAGFKITEDIDSIQTVAAAKRLEESRQYKASVIDAAQAQFEAIKKNYDLLNTTWEVQKSAFDVFLAYLKSKSVTIPINFTGGALPTPAGVPSLATALPEQGIPSFMGGTGSPAAQGNALALGGQTINVTVNAGAIGSEDYLVGVIGDALTKYTRYGNTTAPAGFI